jgi:hypothetical protein
MRWYCAKLPSMSEASAAVHARCEAGANQAVKLTVTGWMTSCGAWVAAERLRDVAEVCETHRPCLLQEIRSTCQHAAIALFSSSHEFGKSSDGSDGSDNAHGPERRYPAFESLTGGIICHKDSAQ